MATFTPEALALTPPLSGQLAYDLVDGKVVPASKIVFGNDNEVRESWSFNAGNADDGTGRVVLASDQPPIPVTDNGGSLTVDGSVEVSSSALPTGAASEATLTSILQAVDSEIQAIVTAVQLLDNVVAGNEIQADVLTMPATAANGAAMPGVQLAIGASDGTGFRRLECTAGGELLTRVQNLTEMTDGDRSRVIYDGLNSLTVKHAAISAATSGNNTLVAAVAAKKIRVISLVLVAAGAVNVTIENGAGGTDLSGPIPLTANSGFVLPRNQDGWFADTSANTLLNLSLSAAVQVSGALSYIEVD